MSGSCYTGIHKWQKKTETSNILHRLTIFSGQYYKASTIIIYKSRVVNMSNLLVTTTLESKLTSVIFYKIGHRSYM